MRISFVLFWNRTDASVSFNSLGLHKNLVFGTWIEILLNVHRKEVETGGTTTVVLVLFDQI